MKKKFKYLIEFIVSHIETDKPLIVIVMCIVITFAIFTGHKYYKYTKTDPQYCELCHIMQETYKAWNISAHRNTHCQVCHSMSLLSQNKLLFSYIFTGANSKIKHDHGSEKPWESCWDCHSESAKQGAITMRKSYGHARHVFMEKIECKECHTADMHNFPPDGKKCLLCHENKGVHGMGMESFACLSCHVYGEKSTMPKKQRCIQCHTNIPEKAPMSTVGCQNCHKPHGKLQPTAIDCLSNCHVNQQSIGRHDRHMNIACLECHKAHEWRVGKELAASLCRKCHEYKDPLSFIF